MQDNSHPSPDSTLRVSNTGEFHFGGRVFTRDSLQEIETTCQQMGATSFRWNVKLKDGSRLTAERFEEYLPAITWENVNSVILVASRWKEPYRHPQDFKVTLYLSRFPWMDWEAIPEGRVAAEQLVTRLKGTIEHLPKARLGTTFVENYQPSKHWWSLQRPATTMVDNIILIIITTVVSVIGTIAAQQLLK